MEDAGMRLCLYLQVLTIVDLYGNILLWGYIRPLGRRHAAAHLATGDNTQLHIEEHNPPQHN